MIADRTTISGVSMAARMLQSNSISTLLIVLAAAIALLYWQSFAWLISEWSKSNERFSHGFLLAAISLFLLVRSGRRLELKAIAPCWWAVPLVVVFSLVWLMGAAGEVIAVQTVMLPMLALSSVCAVLGHSAARQLAFAILYIIFALPVWEHTQDFFQAMTVGIVSVLLKLIGVPTAIDGSIVHLATGSFRITGGCSGVTFLIVGLALAALYGHLYYNSARPRALIIAIALVLSLMANWVRVTAIIVIGHVSQMQSSIVNDHHAFGWMVFCVFLIPMYVFARRLESFDSTAPRGKEIGKSVTLSGSVVAAAVVVMACLAIGPAWASVMTSSRAESGPIHLALPQSASGWMGPIPVDSPWQPVFHGVSHTVTGMYLSDSAPIVVYGGVYLGHEQGSELIYVLNRIEGEFSSNAGEQISPALRDLAGLRVRSLIANDGFDRWQILYWYEIGGRRETSELVAKLWQALATLQGKLRSGVFAVAAKCDDDCAAEGLRLSAFLEETESDLWLRETVLDVEISR